MKFQWLLIVGLVLAACGKKDALTPRSSTWPEKDKTTLTEGCAEDLAPSLSQASRATGICRCWVDKLAEVYSIEDMRSEDDKVSAQSNTFFSECAKNAGENLNTARAALRLPAQEKKPLPKVLQKTLDRVKEKNPPASHSAPTAPVTPKAPQAPTTPAPAEAQRPIGPIAPPIVLPKLGAEFSMTGYRLTKEGQFELNGDNRKSVFDEAELGCTISIGKSVFQDKESKFLLVQAKNKAGETFTLSIQPFDDSMGFYARKGNPSTFDQEVFTVMSGFGALVLQNGNNSEESKASYCEVKNLKVENGILKANIQATKMSGINPQATGRDQLAYGDVNGEFTCKVKDISTDTPVAKEEPKKEEPPAAPVKKALDSFYKAADYSLKSIESIKSILEVNDFELTNSGSISMTRTELRRLKLQAEDTGRKAFKDLEDSSTDQATKDALRTKVEDAVSAIQQKILKQYLRAQQGPG